MYKILKLSIILVTAFLLISGCGEAQRDLDLNTHIDKSKNQPIISQNPEQNITKPSIEPITPTPINDNNETNSTIKVDATNAYKLSMTLSKSQFQQYEIGILHYDLRELYTDDLLNSNIIKSITFHSDDTRYCKFVDFTGKESNELTLNSEKFAILPQNDIRIKMNDHSGTTEILVTAIVTLPDGSERTLYNTIPVVVIKNKTASITVNPFGTKFIKSGENKGLYVEDYVFHVVDQYGNKAKDGTYVQIGVVNDPKLYTLGSSNNVVLNKTGTLTKERTFTIDNLPANVALNKNTDIDNEDNLVILPNLKHNDPTYLGGWDIENITSKDSMTLVDNYTGNPKEKDIYGVDDNITIGDISGLTFVIGDEDRYNPCSHTLANAAFYFPEGAKVKDGLVYAQLRYQPYMVGKSVFVYANAVVDGERIGISREMHLAGEGLKPITASCKNDGNVTLPSCSVYVIMTQNGSEQLSRWVQPGIIVDDPSTFGTVTASNTRCGGGSLVTFTDIAPGKTASASIGDLIEWENIINH